MASTVKICRSLAFAGLIVFVCGCQSSRVLRQSIPASEAVGVSDERTERIGSVIREVMRKEGIPGISVAVVNQGKVVWAQGFGWRDMRRRLPVDTDTQFQAGSISKPVTALGVLALDASGKVDLDADVNADLKDWQLTSSFTNQQVTLRLLLCHRAGMVPHGFLGYRDGGQSPSLLELLNKRGFMMNWLSANYFGAIRVVEAPGSAYRYSGGGYCVVQKVVEDVTGKPFEEAMRELVLEPIGMSRSHFYQPPRDTNNIARGYGWMKAVLGGGRWRVHPEKAMGGLWATPQDLARLIVAVQQGDSGAASGGIMPATAKAFLTPQFDSWQGMGVRLGGEDKNRGFYHNGETFGYFARFGAGVSNGRGWVIMSNAKKNRFGPILEAIVQEFEWHDDG